MKSTVSQCELHQNTQIIFTQRKQSIAPKIYQELYKWCWKCIFFLYKYEDEFFSVNVWSTFNIDDSDPVMS